MKKIIIYTDGGSRGNPGHSAIGVVFCNEKEQQVKSYGEYLGDNFTNNEAEYTALIQGIDMALKHSPKELKCFMDSELVVKQINGIYKIKEPRLQILCIKARSLARQAGKGTFEYIPRSQNSPADSLVNNALDNK